MTGRAGKPAAEHDSRPAMFVGFGPAERSDILLGRRYARLKHVAIRPAGIGSHLTGQLVHLHAGSPVATLHQHITHVEEEPLDVVGRDPTIPARAPMQRVALGRSGAETFRRWTFRGVDRS